MMLVYGDMFSESVERKTYLEFIIRRIARIYPLHVFMLTCFVMSEFAKFLFNSDADPAFSNNTPISIISNLFLVQAWDLHPRPMWNQPSWSISAEFSAYLLFPLLAVQIKRRKWVGLTLIGIGTFALLILFRQTLGGGTLDRTSDFGVLRCLPSFTLGMVLACCYLTMERRWRRLLGADVLLAGLILAVALMLHFGISEIALVACFALIILSGSLNQGVVGRVLALPPLHVLGLLSYSIYMTHSFVERMWLFVSFKLFHGTQPTWQAAVALTVCLAIVAGSSAMTWRLIELPGRKAIMTLGRRWYDRARVPALAAIPLGSGPER